ncbi:MAG: hypothetical protein JW795_14445, partial [Chitinivibrionales bacterium]|nr:hypothetical protein [Chitinivibrionales bacterium]
TLINQLYYKIYQAFIPGIAATVKIPSFKSSFSLGTLYRMENVVKDYFEKNRTFAEIEPFCSINWDPIAFLSVRWRLNYYDRIYHHSDLDSRGLYSSLFIFMDF